MDLVELYLLVTNLATSELTSPSKTDSYTRFFWGSVARHVWGDVAREVGKLLHKKGLIETAEAKSVSLIPELL